jgi:putative ABC transport system substrate-binding protein
MKAPAHFLFRVLLALATACTPLAAAAQAAARLPHIGVIYMGAPSPAESASGGLGIGMRELGYVDGRNVVLDWRYAEGRPERLPALAAELVAANVDVIVTGGPGPFAAARQATRRIPIVTVSGSDPVAEGWANSLARPGGNITGLSVTFPEITAKRLELLKVLMPGLTRVALVLAPFELLGAVEVVRDAELGARNLGLQLQVLNVRDRADIERVGRAAFDGHAQAIVTIETTFILSNRSAIAEAAARQGIPVVGEFAIFGVEGVVMAYGADLNDLLRRSASHVDRILKGARAGDLPIERPVKLDLIVNLKVARALGVAVPQSLLLRAERVVE